ncbi:ATP-dependent protease ClpP protease subunit [Tamilnaduibacter salinus]|nr:head maturation protease, ClpP-related [Tamilnaduibacter salinus]PVY78187.1 ATP-dependent protease ClpP protease subunit [Tamilnaduibacter salinus]
MARNIKAILDKNEIYIYGEIGELDVSAKRFIDTLKTLDLSQTVHVRINSPGGDVAHALGMFNALQELDDVVSHIDGLAASAASVVAMAGKTVMADNAILMIHRPWSMAAGNADDMRKAGDVLDKFQPQLTKAYTQKTGLPDDEVNAMLAEETWFTAEEALAKGFIDEVSESLEIAASVDLSVFNSVPEHISTTTQKNAANRQEIENMLALFKDHESLKGVTANSLIQAGMTTPEAARQHLLAEIGKNHSPIWSGAIPMDENTQLKNFMNEAADAILMRHNVPVKAPTNGARELAGLPLAGLAEKHLNLHGISTNMMSKRQVFDRAFGLGMQSTSDFASLLGNAAGKSLRQAYEEEYGSHEVWTGDVEVPDFKDQSLVQLSEAPDLDPIKEGAEYKHGYFSDDGMTFRIEKFGKLFSLTYEAMINDDLNAFTRLPQAFGKSAKRKEADLVYQVLTGNPKLNDNKALFHADHGNISSGGWSGLTVAPLADARTLMRKQKGVNSKAPINVVPRFLIVPASRETEAEQLLASTVDPSKSNDTVNPNFVRSLHLVVDSRLDEVSESVCYLAASPTQVDTITRAYLADTPRPYYEQREGWEVDGMHVKARLEFAAVPIDYRGLVRIDFA